MIIKILGPGCAKCNKTEKIVKQVVTDTNIEADVEKVTDMLKIAEYGILSTPTVIINGKPFFAGKVPNKKELTTLLNTIEKEA